MLSKKLENNYSSKA